MRAIKHEFRDKLQHNSTLSVVGVLTQAMRHIVNMNMLLSADELSKDDYKQFDRIIVEGRLMFQRICRSASMATSAPKGAAVERRSSTQATHASSRAGSVQSDTPKGVQPADDTIEVDDTDDVIGIGQLDVSQKSVKY